MTRALKAGKIIPQIPSRKEADNPTSDPIDRADRPHQYKILFQKILKMRQNGSLRTILLCMSVCALLFSVQIAFATEEVSIVGMVTEQGIVTYDGQVYAIVDNEKGKEVMKLINRKIEIIGTIIERGDGTKLVEITNYGISE